MTIGMSTTTAAGMLSAVFQAQSFVVSELWMQLHLDDPGSDGTANPAAETRRLDASSAFTDAAADDGTGTRQQITNTVIIGPLSSVTTSETYSFVSYWDAETGGTFVGSGSLTTPKAVTAGDDFEVPIGHCTASLPNAV